MLSLLLSSLRRLERGGLLPVLMVMVCIQGTVIVGQFLVAALLSPSELGVIRSLESALSVMVLVGSVGTQALSVRDIAAEADPFQRMVVLRNLVLVVMLGALAIVAGVAVSRAVLPPSVILDTLMLCSGVVLLSNLLRVMAGYAQGAGEVQHYYRPLILLSALSIGIQMIFAARWRIDGWIAARYLGEGLTVIGLMVLLIRSSPRIPWLAPIRSSHLLRSVAHGVTVNIALVLRLLADTLPVLALTAFKVPTDQIGVFGLASLALVSVTLPLAVLAQRAIPLLVKALPTPEALDALVARLRREMLLTGLVGGIVLVVGALTAHHVIGGDYSQAFLFAALLGGVLPIKAFALASGTHLMVVRRYVSSMWSNLFEVLLVLAVCAVGVPRWGAHAAVLAVFVGAAVSAIALYVLSLQARAVPAPAAQEDT